MIRDVLSGGYRMSLFTAVTLVLAIVYVVFPFDLIPDRIPVAGWIDDAIVLYLALRQLSKETQRYIRHKAMERKNN